MPNWLELTLMHSTDIEFKIQDHFSILSTWSYVVRAAMQHLHIEYDTLWQPRQMANVFFFHLSKCFPYSFQTFNFRSPCIKNRLARFKCYIACFVCCAECIRVCSMSNANVFVPINVYWSKYIPSKFISQPFWKCINYIWNINFTNTRKKNLWFEWNAENTLG